MTNDHDTIETLPLEHLAERLAEMEAEHEDGGLDGNDAWEWYANQGPEALDIARELLRRLEAR